ncbi:MAG: RNA methyltransferase [bacterium]|nr:MAG: RNA methyltransferase [bacterium]
MKDTDLLQEYLLPERRRRLTEVLKERTIGLTVVIENFNKENNYQAVLRTCEAFGIQHVHIVPQPEQERIVRFITQGCEKWLTLHYHASYSSCLDVLREGGYRVVVGSLGRGAVSLETMDFSGRVALVFSNELDGAGEEVVASADGLFVIPLAGFTQSLNVSVAAGIAIHHVRSWKRNMEGSLEGLSGEESDGLLEEWVRGSVRNAEGILSEMRNRK